MKGYCQICGTEIEVRICCSGRDCGCLGQPIDPPVCSQVCWDKFFNKEPMKVCTLRQVADGIVATVDERPEIRDICFNTTYNIITVCYNKFEDQHKIIASTFGVGKELLVDLKKYNAEMLNNGTSITDCDYTENSTQIIIQL